MNKTQKLSHLCKNNSFEEIKSFIKKNITKINLKDDGFSAIRTAITNKRTNVVEYLTTLKQFNANSIHRLEDDFCFRLACSSGNLEMVKHLLLSPNLNEHADIHTTKDECIRWSCRNGHIEVVRYLLTSPDLNEHADIHAEKDYAFKWAIKNNNEKLIHFLIFDYGIKKTKYIADFILETNQDTIDILFKARDLKNQLTQSIIPKNDDSIEPKKYKI